MVWVGTVVVEVVVIDGLVWAVKIAMGPFFLLLLVSLRPSILPNTVDDEEITLEALGVCDCLPRLVFDGVVPLPAPPPFLFPPLFFFPAPNFLTKTSETLTNRLVFFFITQSL